MAEETESREAKRRGVGASALAWRAAVAWSAFLWAVTTVAYLTRPDALAALTVWPVWLWPLPGLLPMLLWVRARRRTLGALALVWLGFLPVSAEEARSLLRLALPPATAERRLRVVTMNCAGGTLAAAEEAATYRPDILLLQETPGKAELEALARRVFGPDGVLVIGLDTSLLTRGKVTERALTRGEHAHFVEAQIRLPSGLTVEAVSLRLMTPPFRADFWLPDFWRSYTANRRLQREQLGAVATRLASLPPSTAVVVGGDFNAPQGDAVFRTLEPGLHDSFAAAGRGWGNTIVNDVPALRIDQVWVSRELRPLAVTAHTTRNSDHRLVVADFAF